jgi:hypothetical protein
VKAKRYASNEVQEAFLLYLNATFGGITAGFFALALNYFYQSNQLLRGISDSDKSIFFGILGIIFAVWGMLLRLVLQDIGLTNRCS